MRLLLVGEVVALIAATLLDDGTRGVPPQVLKVAEALASTAVHPAATTQYEPNLVVTDGEVRHLNRSNEPLRLEMAVTLQLLIHLLVKMNVHLRLIISLRVNILNIRYDEVLKHLCG